MFVLITRNNSNSKAVDASCILGAYLESEGIGFSFVDSSAMYSDLSLRAEAICPQGIDMAVALGGDGTILRTARLIRDEDAPILGINFGNLGFLANSGEDGVVDLVCRAFAGELMDSKRTNLRIDVECEDETLHEGYFALNEIAITRRAMGRTITYSLDISDVHIADVKGDGVILATATGSTAYSLAAGGPLVDPGYSGMIVQPLAPHTLTARAMLTNSNDVVCVDLSPTRAGRQASLFVDGDGLAFDSPVQKVLIRRGARPTRLLYSNRDHFYRYAASTFFKS